MAEWGLSGNLLPSAGDHDFRLFKLPNFFLAFFYSDYH